MSLAELGLVLLQFVVIAAIGWTIGCLGLDLYFVGNKVGLAERALAAVGGFALFSIVLTILHIVTGGAVFGNPFVVPLSGLAVLAHGWYRRLWRVYPSWRTLAPVLVLLLGLFIVPMFAAGSTVREGDPPWHMGWTHELLDGQPLPDGPAPEFARNAYPWGWHGILATTTRLVPGSNPLLAHEALHIVLVLAIPLAAASLARRVRLKAGWPAAGVATLVGGWGWISARGTDFVASPTDARHGADMVVASPNSVYEMFPPALPREMGLVLLALAGTLMLLAMRSNQPKRWTVAGVVAGCAALVSLPMLIPALMWATVCAYFARQKLRTWIRIVLPMAGLFAVWLVPLTFWYFTEGGFVDIVPRLGVEWSIVTALSSWGLLLPLAIAGAYFTSKLRSVRAKAFLGFGAASVLMIVLSIARREFGWTLQDNQTFLHQGRMWPVAHLLGSALAGVAIFRYYKLLRRRDARLAILAVAATFAIGSISLFLSAPELTRLIGDRASGFVYADEDLATGSFLRDAAEELSPGDIVLVEDSDAIAFKLFEFSGVSLAEYDDPRLEGNELRIRYEDLADRYIERVNGEGFTPTHVVVEQGPPVGGEVLAEGEYGGRNWSLVEVEEGP
jgi:hypothetical protein